MPMNNFQLYTIAGWSKAAGWVKRSVTHQYRIQSKLKRWVITHPAENHSEA